MIIIRQKDAPSIHSALSSKDDGWKFSRLLIQTKKANLIYCDDKLHNVSIENKIRIYKLIGELERQNLPFIILFDSQCSIFTNKDYITVVNAEYADDSKLAEFYGLARLDNVNNSKSEILQKTFEEYLLYNGKANFSNQFVYFVKNIFEDGVLTDNVMFIAMSSDGEVFNANSAVGETICADKLWKFDEKYKMIHKPDFELFCKEYESGVTLYQSQLSKFSNEQVVTLLKKYSKLFAQLVKKGHSNYQEHSNIVGFEDYLKSRNQTGFETNNDDNILGMSRCYSCEAMVLDDCGKRYSVEGKDQFICDDCMKPTDYVKPVLSRKLKNTTMCDTPDCLNQLDKHDVYYCRTCLSWLKSKHFKCSECGEEELFNSLELYHEVCEKCLIKSGHMNVYE